MHSVREDRSGTFAQDPFVAFRPIVGCLLDTLSREILDELCPALISAHRGAV